MPARDRYHDCVKASLEREGWTVTHDPLRLRWGARDMYVDLGAETLLAAELGATRIAVEIKSFLGPSPVTELERALGQYVLYQDLLQQIHAGRRLFLAVPRGAYEGIFQDPLGELLLRNQRIMLIVFDPAREEITQWIPQRPGAP